MSKNNVAQQNGNEWAEVLGLAQAAGRALQERSEAEKLALAKAEARWAALEPILQQLRDLAQERAGKAVAS